MDSKESILFIRPEFFYFGKSIEVEMARLGYEVLSYSDRPKESGFAKAMIRLCRPLYAGPTSAYVKRIIAETKNHPVSKVVVILGQALLPRHIRMLRQAFPKAEFVYYLWDSMKNAKYGRRLSLEFDRRYYFESDGYDGFERLENFFDPAFAELPENEKKYDLAYIGTAYPAKLKEADRLFRSLGDRYPARYLYFYLPSPLMRIFFTITHPGYRKLAKRFGLQTQKISKEEVLSIYSQTKILLDFPRANQNGLTMRTLESMAAKKKLITTNPTVVSYDFYNKENIYVFDGRPIDFDQDFFAKPAYSAVKKEIVDRYTVHHFVTVLLNL
ncbi:MAG: hypothetical protein IJU64_04015 [Bacilli bacterium]|nr:hypothetical protein [Bacilli bacterium]